jgi:hypothetical protein
MLPASSGWVIALMWQNKSIWVLHLSNVTTSDGFISQRHTLLKVRASKNLGRKLRKWGVVLGKVHVIAMVVAAVSICAWSVFCWFCQGLKTEYTESASVSCEQKGWGHVLDQLMVLPFAVEELCHRYYRYTWDLNAWDVCLEKLLWFHVYFLPLWWIHMKSTCNDNIWQRQFIA